MGLPKIERDADADKGPYAVILAPTRELAQQVSCQFALRRVGMMASCPLAPTVSPKKGEARVQQPALPLLCTFKSSD